MSTLSSQATRYLGIKYTQAVQSVKVRNVYCEKFLCQASATFDTDQICFDCRPTLDLQHSSPASILTKNMGKQYKSSEHLTLLIFEIFIRD